MKETFENFNRMTAEDQEFKKRVLDKHDIIIYCGKQGSGKTHLLKTHSQRKKNLCVDEVTEKQFRHSFFHLCRGVLGYPLEDSSKILRSDDTPYFDKVYAATQVEAGNIVVPEWFQGKVVFVLMGDCVVRSIESGEEKE
jgi:hypothetical protein